MPDSAERALTSVMYHIRTCDRIEANPEALTLLRKFAETFREQCSDENFTVRHILLWSREYQKLEGLDELPVCFQSGVALGKLIRSAQEWIGIREVGSYGNRIVYQVADTVRHTGEESKT